MKSIYSILIVLFSLPLCAQEEHVHSLYFETNSWSITDKQKQEMMSFYSSVDKTRIETISIYGYCDDIGKDDYNKKLSLSRATTVQEYLVNNGVQEKIDINIEGKGRVLIDDDILTNIPAARAKNRRVDIVLNLKALPKMELLPSMFTTIQKTHTVGDRIYLENLVFDRGSSKLSIKAKNELDKIAMALHRNKKIKIEIQGHVCCVPKNHKEAIDLGTKKRKLSHNRAEEVFKYLAFKKVAKDRMSFKGYGNTQPLGKDVEYDRRVELVITGI